MTTTGHPIGDAVLPAAVQLVGAVRSGDPVECVRCHRPVHPRFRGVSYENATAGRGLCKPCYDHARNTGDLIDYETRNRSRDDLLDDWVVLRVDGYTWRQAAERLGMTYASFERAMNRARIDGDPRAARIGEQWPRLVS